MSDTLWTSDFSVRGRTVRVKKTGAVIPLDKALASEAANWFSLYLAIRAKTALNRLLPRGPAVWFAPDRPRPWYLIWAAASWNGVRIARSPDEADASFFFEDATQARPPVPPHARAFNYACTDISKSRVAEVFEACFGYPLMLDPEQGVGLAVEKGEANGVHDGRLVWLPTRRRPGRTYQRLIDNVEDGMAVDLRTPFVGGKPVVVFIKRRPVQDRFANHNADVAMAEPREVFSEDEIARLGVFCRVMGLDWGGLDILRDRPTGRLYVVDVNKTDMGPPIALPFPAKLKAVARMGRALRALITEQTP
ncbi:MAG: hypothetical protein EPN98_04535 [Phenylobacterium sp.]|uniref:hypothetical protein n=1 Tax=Phenylobacterium sp. TaxID=1871053 RepID=UPI00120387D2|nr:hypothetical protein [Phenylobacterium sp.]TAL36524.1 MAG: hypothetical protein EPN98_04535 [Phenylobacterium sp.]